MCANLVANIALNLGKVSNHKNTQNAYMMSDWIVDLPHIDRASCYFVTIFMRKCTGHVIPEPCH